MSLTPVAPEAPRWATVLVYARQMAEVFANTDFVPKAMRGQPDTIAAAICYGDELGISPAMALQSIDVVEGRPRPSAALARGLILAAGHSLVVHEMNGQRCRLSGLRAGRPESERLVVEWTIEMARAAGLVNRPNWRSYPRAMLAARASSDLANLVFPDVMKGLTWVSEEPESLRQLEAWSTERDAPVAPPLERPRRKTPTRRLKDPGYAIATEEHPGPDGSVDVELPAEPPDPASEPEAVDVPLISPGQMKILQTLLTEVVGSAGTDEERHRVLGLILGREVTTSKTLYRGEASQAIDDLGRLVRGEIDLEWNADGPWRIQAREDQAPQPDQWREGGPWEDLGGRTDG